MIFNEILDFDLMYIYILFRGRKDLNQNLEIGLISLMNFINHKEIIYIHI